MQIRTKVNTWGLSRFLLRHLLNTLLIQEDSSEVQISQRNRQENSMYSFWTQSSLRHRHKTIESQPVQAGAWHLFCFLCLQQKHNRKYLTAAFIPVLSLVFSSRLLVGQSIFKHSSLHTLKGLKQFYKNYIQNIKSPVPHPVYEEIWIYFKMYSDAKSNLTSRPFLSVFFLFVFLPYDAV